ncbi:MAG: hypothetical protein BWX95_01672 [Bacteroidetes bacterium ADurb.Bin141]|nr:MAG: hypothetical protein BWX95_01672 [Bacteroidetes bacterium ADurb.Bin141]
MWYYNLKKKGNDAALVIRCAKSPLQVQGVSASDDTEKIYKTTKRAITVHRSPVALKGADALQIRCVLSAIQRQKMSASTLPLGV